ncbi:MAG: Oligopeptide transport system permease protein OppB [Chloroflexi bacterium ADurb.Bin325]|nr:MAG: Oligopeptide transport system permease protein OppB [Chloroflexi bacterium ADurb.Bin325]
MGGLTKQYVLTRFFMFVLTIWIGATAVFLIPRLAPGDPVTSMVMRMTEREGRVENAQELIAAWKERFGLNDPLYIQYFRYLGNLVRFDFGYSLANFPTTAWEMVRPALPWSVRLLAVALIFSFAIGNTVGALMGWRKTPSWLQNILPLSLTFTSIPYFMFGILLLYFIAFQLHLLPASGGYSRDVTPGWNLPYIRSVITYSILPLVSIVLTSMGGWALGMRGLMVGVNNEDYFLLAQAKGLSPARVFFRYGVRNAILPSLTALALGMGGLISGSMLVEYIFAYPGTGYTLYRAIITQDYTVMQTICNLMILITATSVFLLDLLYPLIDPRITFRRSQM